MTSGLDFQHRFFDKYGELWPIMMLFDQIPTAFFFAKNAESRFVRVNKANLAIYDLTDELEILGKSDADFHPPALAEAYIAEDQRVLRLRRPILKQIWLVPYLNGPMQWFVCSKTPLFSNAGDVIGIAGVMYPVKTPEEELKRFKQLAPAIRQIESQFASHLDFGELANECGISKTHFNRLFQTLLRMTPSQYLIALRIQSAKRLLAGGDESVSTIAHRVGFFDQSHFAKRFRVATGMSPSEYRQQFAK